MAVETPNLLLVTNKILEANSIEQTNEILQPVTVIPVLPTPMFNPVAGSYGSAQSVTITSAGATAIYYTTDGSTPTTGSTLYTGPVTVGTSETLKALATAAGYTNSAIGTAAYVITLGPAFVVATTGPTPSFTSPVVTSAVNTTGANFIAAVVASYDANATIGVTDTIGGISSGNVWHTIGLTPGAAHACTIWYCFGATVGASHVFTVSATGGSGDATPSVSIMAFSGMPVGDPLEAGSEFGSAVFNAANPNVSSTTGTTPVTAGDLVIYGCSMQLQVASGNVTSSVGTMPAAGQDWSNNTQGIAGGYYFAPSTSPINPAIVNVGGTASGTGIIACFTK